MSKLLLIVACVAAWFFYRSFIKEAKRVQDAARRTERERKTGASGTLVQDPVTGEYRVEKGD